MSDVPLSRWVLVLVIASWISACSSRVDDSTAGDQNVSGGGASSGGSSGSGAAGSAATGGTATGNVGGPVNACANGPLSKVLGRLAGTTCGASDGGTTDECLVDSDCSAGLACVCAGDFYGGNGIHGNVCVAAECRTDADCGTSGVCSTSFGERCGGPTGVYCHSAKDNCNTDADCCGSTPNCLYQQTLGHWACQSLSVCNG